MKAVLLLLWKLLKKSEAKRQAINMKMIFHSHVNKTRFHEKGFALSFLWKVRVFGTRK